MASPLPCCAPATLAGAPPPRAARAAPSRAAPPLHHALPSSAPLARRRRACAARGSAPRGGETHADETPLNAMESFYSGAWDESLRRARAMMLTLWHSVPHAAPGPARWRVARHVMQAEGGATAGAAEEAPEPAAEAADAAARRAWAAQQARACASAAQLRARAAAATAAPRDPCQYGSAGIPPVVPTDTTAEARRAETAALLDELYRQRQAAAPWGAWEAHAARLRAMTARWDAEMEDWVRTAQQIAAREHVPPRE
jgi:hypothetical protein